LRVCLKTLESGDEVIPDLETSVDIEILVTKGELDTGLKSLVEGTDSVARQDEDS
jgi:hypothetical protein